MKNHITKMAVALGLTGLMLLNPSMAAAASGADAEIPTVARTKAWDGIAQTLGGVPESVVKIEYAGSVFYLGKDVTEADFLAVLAAGPEAVRMKAPQGSGRLYAYPVYILRNSDKTVLLVHPIIFDYDDVLEAVAVPTAPPASLTGSQTVSEPPKAALSAKETPEYLLSAEYADAVRNEFYRLLNEHRAASGLRELEINLELQEYADIRADEQRTRSGHIRPDGSAAGSGWHNSKNNLNTRYAENAIGVGSLSADPADAAGSIFSMWKNSKGHNRHMLYDFGPKVTMAFGIAPQLDEIGTVTSAAIFATGH
jgi:uncharacterized protein YkwD